LAKKQLISAFVDLETYLALKSQEVNVSEIVRNALRAAVECDIPEDEEFLVDEIKKDREVIREASKRLSKNSMKLSVLQEKRAKTQKELETAQDDYHETLKRGGALDF
jgi:hypothetical protein